MRRLLATLAVMALLAGVLLGQPQLQQAVFSSLRVSGGITAGSLTDQSVQELDVLSAASDLGGGLRISRTLNGSYLILNANTTGATGVGYIQAGDDTVPRPIAINPGGGGMILGPAGTVVSSIVAGSATWDPPSTATGASTAAIVTVNGAATSSVCHAGHAGMAGVNDLAITAQASATGAVRALITNNTGSSVDVASGTVRVVCFNVP